MNQVGPRNGLSLLREKITRSGRHLDIIKNDFNHIYIYIYIYIYIQYRRFPLQVFVIFLRSKMKSAILVRD
jgi:hypothetical protein